jgi:hypothetical protein
VSGVPSDMRVGAELMSRVRVFVSGWFDEGFDEAQMKCEIVEEYVLFAFVLF